MTTLLGNIFTGGKRRRVEIGKEKKRRKVDSYKNRFFLLSEIKQVLFCRKSIFLVVSNYFFKITRKKIIFKCLYCLFLSFQSTIENLECVLSHINLFKMMLCNWFCKESCVSVKMYKDSPVKWQKQPTKTFILSVMKFFKKI